MIERFLIEHCSATLASIKAANLCNMTFSSKEELEDQISYWSACLEPKGIHSFVSREHETRAWSMCTVKGFSRRSWKIRRMQRF